jgi:outer membrane protein assembly factor BamB
MSGSSEGVRLRPPLGVFVAMALAVGAAVWVVRGNTSGDGGMDNSIAYGFVFLGLATYAVWFLVAHRRQRWAWGLVLGVPVAVALLGFLLVRDLHWTGAITPRIEFVWSPRPVELAGGSVVGGPTSAGGAETAGDVAPDVVATDGAAAGGATPDALAFPGFLGPERTGVLAGPRLARDWDANPPELVWRVPVGAGWSGFAVVDGLAITQEQRGTEQLVVARDVTTGEERWRRAHPQSFDHMLGGAGPRATPTVAHGLVYAQDTHGVLECLDLRTGEVRWREDVRARYGMTDELEAELVQYGRSGSPLVHGEMVVLPAGGDPAGRHPGLVAFDRRTGELLWEGPPRQISHASPTVATLAGVEQILVVNNDTVSGHRPSDGTLLWEEPWPGHTNADANNSQPVALPPDRVLVSKGYGQGSRLLQLVPGEGGALSPRTVWSSRRALRTKLTNVVVRGDHAYGLSDGILECVALADGERVWRDGRYGHGQVLLVDDLLLVVSEEGELFLVEATPERENNVLGSVQAVDGKTWNNLALYGDLVLVRNATEATAWRLTLAP